MMDTNNDTFASNLSKSTVPHEPEGLYALPIAVDVIYTVVLSVGIPGNLLSAIIWLRKSAKGNSSSAVYLATLAVNDLSFLTVLFIRKHFLGSSLQAWLGYVLMLAVNCTANLEPLLVLAFSVGRLLAVRKPLQAKVLCRPSRAKKVVAALTVACATFRTTLYIIRHCCEVELPLGAAYLYNFVMFALVPLAVLVINVLVVCEVRRASNSYVSAGLGRNQTEQSPSPNSAVPTVMLLVTSFLYVALWTGFIAAELFRYLDSKYRMIPDELRSVYLRANVTLAALMHVVFAYNFFVYVITGRQFRQDLIQLMCWRCHRITHSHVTSGTSPQQGHLAVPVRHTTAADAVADAGGRVDNEDDADVLPHV